MNGERDITSTLRRFAEGIYVGSQVDVRPGATIIDVRELPESPWNAADIKRSDVDVFMRAIDQTLKDGEVLIACTYGVNRAPSIAKLYCIGKELPFNWYGSFPNKAWYSFVRKNFGYYRFRGWR